MPSRTVALTLALFSLATVGLIFTMARADQPQEQALTEQEMQQIEQLQQMQHADPAELADASQISYALGFQIGSDLAGQEIELEPQRFIEGMQQALAGEEPEMSEQELMQALIAFQMQMQQRQQEQMAAAAEDGRAFLEANIDEEGVEQTDSGLQYRIIEEGEGESPEPGDIVTVHYEGRLVDGTVFDSSHQRGEPARFPSDRLIPGWTEGLSMMKPGAKWELFIPSDLAYGPQGQPPTIPPEATLIFEVELLDVEPADSP